MTPGPLSPNFYDERGILATRMLLLADEAVIADPANVHSDPAR
jgi:hypothetical protein